MEFMIGLAVVASFVAMSFAIAAVLKNVQANKKQRETETFNAIVGAAQVKHGFNYPGTIDGYWPQNEEEAHNYANILDNVILELDMACDTLERGSRVFELVKSHRFSLVRQLKLIEAIKFGGMTSKEAKATPLSFGKDTNADLNVLLRQATRSVQPTRTSAAIPQPKSSPDTGRNKNGPYGGNARMGSHDNRRNDDDNFAVGFGLGYGQGYVDTTPSRSSGSGSSSRCDDNSSSRDYDSGPSGGGCDSGGGGGGE